MNITEMIKSKMTWGDVMRKYDPALTDEQIDYILWNDTCYPFDLETTLKQIDRFFSKPFMESKPQ